MKTKAAAINDSSQACTRNGWWNLGWVYHFWTKTR